MFFFTLCTLLLTGAHITLIDHLLHPHQPAVEEGDPAPHRAIISEPVSAGEALRVVTGEVGKGTGLAVNLRAKGVRAAEVEPALSALAPVLDFRRLRSGDRFSLQFDHEGSLQGLTYRTGLLEQVVLRRDAGDWEAARETLPFETRVETVVGRIGSSLFESLEGLGEGDRLAMDFVDIFAWDIDFSHELQRGDTFRIVVEKIYRDGEFVTYGKILAAQYRDSEELHEAFHFPHPDEGGDYYTADGTAVRKTFLRAPVAYSRISSGYSRQRLHPVLKRVRPHLGVDYAAPAGTPVWAAADGVVETRSQDRANGRKLVVRHPNGYKSFYLHLSRYAAGVKPGSRVKQKQVIGYVGSSGLSTGPHLDYRLQKGGRWVNPLKEKFPAGDPLPGSSAERFAEYREWLTGKLTTPPESLTASADTTIAEGE